jgi:thioredoxin reductase
VAQSARRGGGDLDAVVVGAGPAGIAATLELMAAGLRVELLEREAFGGTITHYPRRKLVMTGPIDLPRYGKVSRRTMTKEELGELFEDVRQKTGLSARTGELVTALRGTTLASGQAGWEVQATSGAFRAASVLLALGRRGAPQKLGVPGEELSKVAYRLLEPDPFQGQDVLVVGGGNAAVECALALADFGACKSVAISYRRDAFARCRAENRRRIDEALKSGRVRGLLPSTVRSIAEREVVLDQKGTEVRLPNDAVIVQIGGSSPTELLASFGIEMVTKYGER